MILLLSSDDEGRSASSEEIVDIIEAIRKIRSDNIA